MDRTDRLLVELGKMINSDDFCDLTLKNEVIKIIADIRNGHLNIIDLRQSLSRLKYGDDVIDLFAEANNNLAL